MRVRLIPWCLVGLLWATSVSAQNAITPAALIVTPTFNSLGVTAPFTGDANGNATLTLQFRPAGSGSYLNAYPPYIDRRQTVGGSANPYVNQARGAIVGLAANTSWDVKVTWADGDGVTSQPAVVTVSTLTKTPPTGSGTTRNVTDNTTQASALAAANPGDTLVWASGTYNAFTFSRSGDATHWIILDGGGVATINGAGVDRNVALKANFVILKNFILSASDFDGIDIGAGDNTTFGTPTSQQNIFIQGNTLQGISTLCANNPTGSHGSGGHYDDVGVGVSGGSSQILVLNNTIAFGGPNSCVQNPTFNGPGTGVAFTDVTQLVVQGNTVTGAFRDAISSDGSSDAVVDSDLVGNTVLGYVDDGVESKGDNRNVRIWANVITASGSGLANAGNTCIAGNTNTTTNQYGPYYLFRNTCRATAPSSGGTTVYKTTPTAPVFYFHNSIDASPAGSNWDVYVNSTGNGAWVGPIENNIAKTKGSVMFHNPGNTISDYNDHLTTGTFAWKWNDVTDYATWAAFKTGTGQESHGANGDPAFTDTALHIPTSSPAKDIGLVIPNFNSLDSAWPYAGAAPDAGAWESGAAWATLEGTPITGGVGPAPPGPPTNFTIAGL